jgi:hypothetical protein
MVPGFNTDFKYRGETYHVQTEDNGLGNPVVVTLLYHKGAILASRRTPYHELIGKTEFEKELMGLMKNQHKELMRALLAGAYDKNGAAPAIAVPTAQPTMQPLPEHVAAVTFRATPGATEIPRRTIAPRSTETTLDEAIRRFLEEFAATAAATN